MKLYREDEVAALLDGILKFSVDLQKGNKTTRPIIPRGIEITEEEMRKIPYQIADTFGGGLYGDYFKASKLTIEMILSKLKGE
jgi:hypothetical protein